MRHLLLTLAMLAVCLQTVEAQDEITIHVDGQPLAELITAEQQKSLQTLNITGELAEEDYAFLREGNLPQLRELNLRKANIHTIPKKAFYGWNLEYGFFKNGRIVLPESLECVEDSACCNSVATIELTGKFPAVGFAAFAYSHYTKHHLEISEDNPYCKDTMGYILSSDKTVLWYNRNTDHHPLYIEIPSEVEIIAEKSFEYASFCQLTIPKSVKTIQDYAFIHCEPDGTISSAEEAFIMESTTPPTLGREVFSGLFWEHKPALVVPDGCIDSYCEADVQWHKFKTIQNEKPVSNIEKTEKDRNIIIDRNSGMLSISSHIAMKQISIYSLQGERLYHVDFRDKEMTHTIPHMDGRLILEIILSTGEKQVIKL